MRHPKLKVGSNRGFSLVEMLVVIAVIGILAAIAVPNIGRINDASKDATYRRNAQSIASVYASAQAAGHDFKYSDGSTGTASTDAAEIAKRVIAGAAVSDTTSPFNGTFFGVPNVADADVATGRILNYLTWDATNGILKYDNESASTTTTTTGTP